MKVLNLVLLMIFAVSTQAQTTEFTFQGKLNESGTPVSSPRDLRFRLWNAESAGTQVGIDVTVANVVFAAGIFSVRLDFGEAAFTGQPRWIEMSISPPGAGTYVTLQPRQSLGSSPYSIKSLNSDSATTAQDSNSLGGISATQYVQTVDSRLSDARDPLPGSASYVQNQNAAPQTSTNFNISGTGTANILRAETQFNLGTSRVFHSPGSNLFIGKSTGTNFATGFFNTVVGGTAGNGMANASANSIFGNGAGFDNQGSENSFFGMHAGQQNQSGGANSFFGKDAGAPNLSGTANSFFGIGSGAGNTTGSNNTLVGAATNTGADGLSFATAIGAGSVVSSDNTLVLGRAADTVQIPGSLNVAGTFGANIFNATSQYHIGGVRILHNPGNNNMFVGTGTGGSITSGAGNAFFGAGTGAATTSGISNSFFGYVAGAGNTNGQGNSYFGAAAGNSGNGSHNSFFGRQAGLNASGGQNSFFGPYTGLATTGGLNSFFGYEAGNQNTTGDSNTFLGAGAGKTNQTGRNNIFIGNDAGWGNTTGSHNIVIGSLPGNSTGEFNTVLGTNINIGGPSGDLKFATAIGSFAVAGTSDTIVLGKTAQTLSGIPRPADTVKIPGTLEVTGNASASSVNASQFTIGGNPALSYGNPGGFNLHVGGDSPNSTGTGNSFGGRFAGFANTSGNYNTYFGLDAGRLGTTGGGNSAFGKNAARSAFLGNDNTFIGQHSDFANVANPFGNANSLFGTFTTVNSGVNNSSAIGNRAYVTQSNSLVLGSINGINGGTADTSVGIGTTAPQARLEVQKGDILIGTAGQGLILRSPDNTKCVKLTIDNTPTFIGTVVPCP